MLEKPHEFEIGFEIFKPYLGAESCIRNPNNDMMCISHHILYLSLDIIKFPHHQVTNPSFQVSRASLYETTMYTSVHG